MSGYDARFAGNVFQKNYPIILACNRHLATLLAVRLAYNADGYPAGQVLARNNVSGIFQKYNGSGSSGLDAAAAILFEDISAEDFSSDSSTIMGVGIFGGEVFKAKLTDLDSDAITDFKARTVIDATGVEILKF